MKVTKLETIRLDEFPNLVWVHVQTDEGLVGLGETFFGAQAVEAYLHETVAPYLIGKDLLQIDRHARALYGYLGYCSSGVELRGNSAIDIALWDLFGKATNQPIYQLLGGLTRANPDLQHLRRLPLRPLSPRPTGRQLGAPTAAAEGPYEDLDAFLHRADELALSLTSQGITGMKIWPFDPFAEASGGMYISARDLDTALEPFRKIRAAVGREIDIMVEFHSLWNLPTAINVAAPWRSLNRIGTKTAQGRQHRRPRHLRRRYRRPDHRQRNPCHALVVPRGPGAAAARIIMLDLSWVGGIGEAKIASMAETYQLPIAPHDCTGPVVLMASMHLSLNAPNALIQETVRAYYTGWYTELVTDLPVIERVRLLPNKPGLGTESARSDGSAGRPCPSKYGGGRLRFKALTLRYRAMRIVMSGNLPYTGVGHMEYRERLGTTMVATARRERLEARITPSRRRFFSEPPI